MDVLKIFKKQEPINTSNLPPATQKLHNEERNKLNEIISQKQLIIQNSQHQIAELEGQISDLKLKDEDFQTRESEFKSKENEFEKVMRDYDELFRRMLADKASLVDEGDTMRKHIGELELVLGDVLGKFEKGKHVILSMRQNEEMLKKELTAQRAAVQGLGKEYAAFRTRAETELQQAKVEISNKHKGNIEEVARLKAKILQSQAKISELEKYVKFNEIDSRTSIFTPLTHTHLLKK